MRVLVTGATGFVGGVVTARLCERGDEVRALVRSPSDELSSRGVEQRVADLTRVDEVGACVEDVDAVVHAAADLGSDLELARRVNRDGTAAIVDALADHPSPRLVHVSTTAVYDRRATGDAAVAEDAPLVTEGSPYAVTKMEAEAEVDRGVSGGLSALVLRPPAVLGPGPRSVWGTRVPDAVRRGAYPRRDPGTSFAWVHVEDLASAVLVGIDGGVQATVNVVAGHRTLGEYLTAVAAAVGADPPLAADAERGWHGRIAGERLPEVLGMRPIHDFEDAMEAIAASWAS